MKELREYRDLLAEMEAEAKRGDTHCYMQAWQVVAVLDEILGPREGVNVQGAIADVLREHVIIKHGEQILCKCGRWFHTNLELTVDHRAEVLAAALPGILERAQK